MRTELRQVRLLVVEDDDGDFVMIERALDEARIVNEVVRAKDGIQALEILRGTEATAPLSRPYFVLCDINLPRLGGLGFLSELRQDEALRHTPIFMLTTSRHDEDKQRAWGLNVAGYISKNDAGKGFLDLVGMLGGYLQVVDLP